MSGADPKTCAPADALGEVPGAVPGGDERSVDQIREDFARRVAELKQKYGRLLEQQDCQIKELRVRLAKAPAAQRKCRVLIVDDAASTAQMANRYLEGHSAEIAHVAAAQARERLRSDPYDAVLIEAACAIEPELDGLAFGRQLCAAGDRKCVVVMSSRPGDKVRQDAEQAGAVFLRKPFRRAQLVQLMQNVLLREPG